MKKRLNFITIIALSAATLSFSSCLKDSRYINFGAAGTTIELPLAGYQPNNLDPEAFNISSTPGILPVVVNVASPKPLTSALSVTLELATDSATAYNAAALAAGNTQYPILPAADYTVSSWTVTVPANQRTATLNISINTTAIDPSQQYLLPIKIASASGQTINQFNTVLYLVQVKNKYDGEYTVTGTLTDPGNAAITGDYPLDVDLLTQSATSDVYSDVVNGEVHLILSSGSVNGFGVFAPVFTFDPTTNKITSVTNAYGQPEPTRQRAGQLDPTGVNAFTAGTPGSAGSVFQVKYILTTGGNTTAIFDETWTYKGPR